MLVEVAVKFLNTPDPVDLRRNGVFLVIMVFQALTVVCFLHKTPFVSDMAPGA